MPSPFACLRSSPTLLLTVIGLPLLGAALAGRDLRGIFQFPPALDIPTNYTHFSWLGAGAVMVVLACLGASWTRAARRSGISPTALAAENPNRAAGPFPSWGWAAIIWVLAWWLVGWTRSSVFEMVQRYTFFPLWLGFVIAVNALAQQRTGTCLMRRALRDWLELFGASAGFWWIFEWLNRFVHNWHYLGVADFGPADYALHASLCFSTVLPAVAAVAEALESYPRWTRRTAAGPRWSWLDRRTTALALVLGGFGALLLTGAFPQWFYPSLWAAPLALFLGTSILNHRGGLAREVARGDWSRAATWMMAGLICGFFWELWNWRSFAKWIYTVPGVDRWHVFEMPLLGFAGYLPFGLECLLMMERISTRTTGQKDGG